MDLNSLRLNAYMNAGKPEKSKDISDEFDEAKNISQMIREVSSAGDEKPKKDRKTPLVHKPLFEKINSKNIRMEKNHNEKLDELTRQKAEAAAKSGTWFAQKKTATSEDVLAAAKTLKESGLIKVPVTSKNGEDSIFRRVAKFLVIIGVDEAAKILPHLTEEQIEKIVPEMASIKKITPEESCKILSEFEGLIARAREEGGMETARNILVKAYGEQKADLLMKKSLRYPEGKPFDYLQDSNPERIKILIEGESVAVQAIVLSQIEPKKAAQVINSMDVKTKGEIVLRLAKMKSVNPDVLENLNKSLHEKMLTQNTENSQNMDGRGVLAQILKRMDVAAESSIINTLSEQDPELGADLRKRLFTEEDVIACDDRFLQNYLHDMDNRDIAVLIRAKSIEFREKILSNVSHNRAQVILDEESMLEHLTRTESERMTSSFYSYLRRAWERGELRIFTRDDGEVYV
ncbi:MAG: FliG C-terminal domain-containing protein [Treponema sp.]|nr:FliG C-terminal domain-containing protein [Treponema sp.]